ncbi:HlyD family secretion protein [Caulobacter rhizosphaerae]|jgi:multidrug resistance efflux pump|uniref:HlyD family secretion protein n=1 Tax=Caulobacter rhizosphaerae TaxID=2010972 RepID=UPI0013D3F895|nr:HlyD family efflux transporter periplasmic adaptor subunit [Caulobacter rhizosphaerae]GGL11478.1 secretion protein HlyD [Caulobacter rhizosphaerae]
MAARGQALAIWRSRKWTVVAAVSGVAVLGLCLALAPRRDASPDPAAPQTLTLSPRPFAATLSLVGSVVPGDSLDVVASFDGVVRRLSFEYGTSVTPGQVLVELDPAEIGQRRNEAEAAYLKASKTAETLADWSSGTEVARARRTVDAAALDLADLDRKLAETRGLLDRGLVARGEYDGLAQQKRNQEMVLAGARQDLAAVLAQGAGANRRVAALDLANARAQLTRLDGQAAGAIVRAPEAGVIVRPVGKGDEAEPLHAGQAVTRGRLIGSIARAGGLAVAFQLSETDANRVQPGMAVTVTGPGFGGLAVAGHVTSVAGQAAAPAVAGGPLASFPATARLDALTPDQAKAIRIGMTANITVDLYRNPAALVAPPAAIQGAAPAAWVKVQDRRGGPPRTVPVKLGRIAPDGVEIVSGVKAGDVLMWATPTAGAASPAS